MPDALSSSSALPFLAAALAFGYLLGSVPFGLILTRLAGLGDVRAIGSGNIGATNVLRTGHKGLAAATLAADALKGTAAVLIAARFGPDTAIAAGLGAFLGHLFPAWLKFRGGKGVATYIGILAGLYWPAALAFCLVGLYCAVFARISSFAGLSAALSAPIFLIGIGEIEIAGLACILTLLTWIRHHANISRLLAGSEPRIGAGKDANG